MSANASTRKNIHPVARYFLDIWDGLYTTSVGMWITLRHMFNPHFTLPYPEVRPVIPDTHRGIHAYDETKCTACGLCKAKCPVDCIAYEAVGKGKNAMLLTYTVDYSRCLFCNLCAEACPTQCLRLTEKYDLARVTRQECVLELANKKTDADVENHKATLAQKEAERTAAAKGGQEA